jgi:hypothetical protein
MRPLKCLKRPSQTYPRQQKDEQAQTDDNLEQVGWPSLQVCVAFVRLGPPAPLTGDAASNKRPQVYQHGRQFANFWGNP